MSRFSYLCPQYRPVCCAALALLLLLGPKLQAKALHSAAVPSSPRTPSPVLGDISRPNLSATATHALVDPPIPLIVIGFMGGNVRAGNLVHREASMAKDLQRRYPHGLHAMVFANHDGSAAFKAVLQMLDGNRDGRLSSQEKNAARIVIYGHSWGASETVTLARRLNQHDIPVLLTIQVDSVEKFREEDGRIPSNVRAAINFYQSDGLLHGRSLIEAMDPAKTDILGNIESTYKTHPISCAGYPWYARAFMKPHIEIENDPRVWNRIEALIGREVIPGGAR